MIDSIADVDELEERLSEPTDYLLRSLKRCIGDTIILGVGGKMGPSLARMLVRACRSVGDSRKIVAVSRFTDASLRPKLESLGITTVAGDLLDDGFIDSLPDAANVIQMTGLKFGTGGQAALTWAMNTHLPSLVCNKYRDSRIMAFSTGNVYPFVSHDGPWSTENDALAPVGEYGMSALGRERMFQYFCDRYQIPTTLVRLNYSVEMRYGVLVDIAQQVYRGDAIDLSMGYANVIWQSDANAMALASLADASVPVNVINVAGPELVCVRSVAQQFADAFGKEPVFQGEPSGTALLNDGSAGHQQYDKPRVPLGHLIAWIADWIRRDQPTLSKPTHFQVRSGKF